MLSKLLGINNQVLRSFSYFIPSPPHRKSGYRERELDEILNKLLDFPIEIIQTNTQSGEQGMWFNIIYKAQKNQVEIIEKHLETSTDSLFAEQTTTISEIYYEDEPEI